MKENLFRGKVFFTKSKQRLRAVSLTMNQIEKVKRRFFLALKTDDCDVGEAQIILWNNVLIEFNYVGVIFGI